VDRAVDEFNMATHTLAVILARAGSKGLANKNGRMLAERPMIAHTILDARASERIDAMCATTDLPAAAEAARAIDVFVVDRPPALATDTATVDAAARHAVETYEQAFSPVTHVAILYANVPVRAPGIIDRAVAHLIATGADSVRSLRRVEKQHPDWLHRLQGDRMVQYQKNAIYRRQDLEPLYYHDGAVVAVTRAALFLNAPVGNRCHSKIQSPDAHAFLGQDRRGILSEGGPTIDVDSAEDLSLAEAVLEKRRRSCVESAIASY